MSADQASQVQNIADPKYLYSYSEYWYHKQKQTGPVVHPNDWADGTGTPPRPTQVSSVNRQLLNVSMHLQYIHKLVLKSNSSCVCVHVCVYVCVCMCVCVCMIEQWKLETRVLIA